MPNAAPMNPPGNYTPPHAMVPASGAPLALAPTAETAGMVLAAQAKALVEARYTIALKQPRDIDVVRRRLMRECERPSFAEVAIYHKPVGDGIEGPSIRFAEAALQAMSNILIDTPTIYDDADKRIMRVSVADMETNVAYSKDVTIHKTVERSRLQDGDEVIRQRTNSRGRTVYLRRATDEEILNTENALVSKALRTVGLRLIPGWLIEECLEAVRATRKKRDAADPDAAKNKLYDSFGRIGVDLTEIKEWLGHDGAMLQPKELEELRSIYTAIKDGDTTWREVMEAHEAKKKETGDKAPPSGSTPVGKGVAGVKDAMRKNGAVEPPPDDTLDPGKDPKAMDGGSPNATSGEVQQTLLDAKKAKKD